MSCGKNRSDRRCRGHRDEYRPACLGFRDEIGVDPEDKLIVCYIDRIVKPDQLDEVIPEAAVVFLSAQDTPDSHKMFGTKEFELRKEKLHFIAVSRGGIYDMNGLVKALDRQRSLPARTDVTDSQPLPKRHPLCGFSNLTITPHLVRDLPKACR